MSQQRSVTEGLNNVRFLKDPPAIVFNSVDGVGFSQKHLQYQHAACSKSVEYVVKKVLHGDVNIRS